MLHDQEEDKVLPYYFAAVSRTTFLSIDDGEMIPYFFLSNTTVSLFLRDFLYYCHCYCMIH